MNTKTTFEDLLLSDLQREIELRQAGIGEAAANETGVSGTGVSETGVSATGVSETVSRRRHGAGRTVRRAVDHVSRRGARPVSVPLGVSFASGALRLFLGRDPGSVTE